MSQAPETLEGWYALHDVRHLDRVGWAALSAGERKAAIDEAAEYMRRAEALEGADEGSSAFYRVLGHKGDLLAFHLRPTLEDLYALEDGFESLELARYLVPADSFVSVVELGQHGGSSDEDQEPPAFEDLPEYVQNRLKPRIPDDMPHICFYPMDKRRGEQVNWFTLSPEERADLMESHGRTGRKYAGKILQIITGAMGLDDWEWGVTLFAHDPLQFKKLVYEMRFDRVSADYADFGPFVVGLRVRPDELSGALVAPGV